MLSLYLHQTPSFIWKFLLRIKECMYSLLICLLIFKGSMLPYPCPLPSGRWWPRHHNQSLCKTHSLLANQFFKISALIYLSLNTTSHFGEISLYSFKSHCPEEDNRTTVLRKKPSLPFAFSKGVILSKIDLNNPIYRCRLGCQVFEQEWC